jgi:chromosome segregation ATPase
VEQANAELTQEAGKLREAQAGLSANGSSSPEAERLFRESLQLQVELKFATDELVRLREVEGRLEQEKWVAAHERGEREAAERELERVERELAAKNRALMVEAGKTKMMSEEINQLEASYELLRDELEKNRSIIHNGQQQLTAF